MTGTAGPVSPCFAQAVARQLQGAGTSDGAPGNLSPARGWVIIQADNKGLSSKHPPPPPRHCGFSRPRRGRLGAPSGELTRGHSYAGGLPLNKVRLFCQSPGDSEPRHSDSLAPRPCLALRDAQPGPFSPQSGTQLPSGSRSAWALQSEPGREHNPEELPHGSLEASVPGCVSHPRWLASFTSPDIIALKQEPDLPAELTPLQPRMLQCGFSCWILCKIAFSTF